MERHALGVITGEVGEVETIAIRVATAALDASGLVAIYLPDPFVGGKELQYQIVSALGHVPSF